MSNGLCYNCGESHLPQPCTAPINRCDICGNSGHFWYFCHLGARQRDPNFVYHFLCQNCNKWHLPIPCMSPIVQCGQCDEYGHGATYCPVDPLPLPRPNVGIKTEEGAVKPATKRQRTAGSGRMTVAPVQMSVEQVQSIRLQAAQETVDYLKAGNEPGKVLQYIGMAPTMPLLSQSSDVSSVGGPVVGGHTSQHIVEYDSPYNQKKVTVLKMKSILPSNATPTSSASHGTYGGPILRIDNVHHGLTEDNIRKLFEDQGPIASVYFGSQGTAFVTYVDAHDARIAMTECDGRNANGLPIKVTMVPLPAAPIQPHMTGLQYVSTTQSNSQQGTPQPAKKTRRASRPRCPACKLKKMRCTHIVPDEPSLLPEGDTEVAQSQVMPEASLPLPEQIFQEIQSHGSEAQAEWLKDAAEKMHSQ